MILSTSLLDSTVIGALIALKPLSYAIRLSLAGVAFAAAINVEKTIARVIGFVWLLLSGAGFLLVGLQHGTVVDILLGLAGLGAAGYSWWYTRS